MKTKVKKYLLVVAMVLGVVISLGGNAVEASEKVDINSATIEDLQKLEGVGAPLAQKIIDARPYKTVEELKEKVVGIGPAKLKAIQDQGLAVAESFPEKIDLNKASLYDLQFLVGVGEPLAQKIIAARPYKSVDELKDKVEGIGDIKLQAIKDQGLAIISIFPAKIKDIFPDEGLASAVANEMKKEVSDEVTEDDLLNIYRINCYSFSEGNLEGIQYLSNVRSLYLINRDTNGARIEDISLLKDLNQLSQLNILGNKVVSIDALSKLKNLSELNISNNQIENIDNLSGLEKLQKLEAGTNSISSIKGLNNLPKLHSLTLDRNKLESVEGLENCSNLNILSLSYNPITSMDGLRNLTTLTFLRFIDSGVEDISAISHLKSLNTLYMQKNKITDLSPLKSLSELGKLSISENGLESIDPLSELTTIYQLDISKNKIKDIKALEKMKKLSLLVASNNQIENFDVIEEILPKLYKPNCDLGKQVIYLPKKIISEGATVTIANDLNVFKDSVIKPTNINWEGEFKDNTIIWKDLKSPNVNGEGLKSLQYQYSVTLSNKMMVYGTVNQIVEFSDDALDLEKKRINQWFPDPNFANEIANLTGLKLDEEVTINKINRYLKNPVFRNKNIKNIEGVQYLKHNYVDFSNNEIEDITPLSKMANLSALYMNDNKIKNITPLSGLSKLSILQLNNNQIKDVSPLSDLINLYKVQLSDNNIEDLSHLKSSIKMVELSADDNEINNIDGLGSLVELKSLKLQRNQISSIDTLVKLNDNIELLYLNDNEIEKVFSFENFDKLINLSLANNKMKNVDAFANCKTLQTVNLMNNQIENLEGVKNLESCKMINFTNNKIREIPSFSNLEKGYLSLLNQTVALNPIVISKNEKLQATIPLVLKSSQGDFYRPVNLPANTIFDEETQSIIKTVCSDEQENIQYTITEERKVGSNHGKNDVLKFSCKVEQLVIYSVDKSELQALYDSLINNEKGTYSDKSWANFQSELNKIRQLLDKTDATKEELEEAKTSLERSYENLWDLTDLIRIMNDLVNEHRVNNGTSPLTLNEQLLQATEIRAIEIAKQFSHDRPDGSSWVSVLDEIGYNRGIVGENIAYNWEKDTAIETATTLFNQWKESPGHNRNMLNVNYAECGYGFTINKGYLYGVQIFGRQKYG